MKNEARQSLIDQKQKKIGKQEKGTIDKTGPDIIQQARQFIFVSAGNKEFSRNGEVFKYPDQANREDKRNYYPEKRLKESNALQ